LTNKYGVRDGKIIRTNPFCPRCGEGVFMADKGEWWSCGKCGDRHHKKNFKFLGSHSRPETMVVDRK
jgi:small subunit ribosomal protein S27Ae